MGLVYLTTDKDNKVDYMHFLPFHEEYGLGKTKEELLETGYLLEEEAVIAPEVRDGVVSTRYYTPEKGFWFEYKELTNAEKLGVLPDKYNQIIDEFTMSLVEGGIL